MANKRRYRNLEDWQKGLGLVNMKEPDFYYFFQNHAVFETNWGKGITRNIDAGILNLPSGQVVACDPFVFPGTTPFVKKVPSGNYPVILNIVYYVDDGDERIGATMIQIKQSRPVRWEMALKEGQDPEELGEDEVFGYPVDSGTGCFAILKRFENI